MDAFQGTAIGVLMSATLPARLGEPARALIVARRAGRPRETTPVVIGTIVSQTMLNVAALVVLGIIAFSSVHVFDDHHGALAAVAVIPLAMLLAVLAVPVILRAGTSERFARLHAVARPMRAAMLQVRAGLRVFRVPRAAAIATIAQFAAWTLQWFSCYLLLVALGLGGQAGLGAAAAVLLAVNVTAAARRRRRTSASSRPRASRSSRARTACRRRTRSATASCCRPWRSRPRSSWACRRCSTRA